MPGHLLNAVWYLNLAATTLLVSILVRTRLYRVYPFLTAYLLADALETVAGMASGNNRTLYGIMYVTGQSVKIILAVFVVLELCRAVLASRPALARFGRNVTGYVLFAAALVSFWSVMLDRNVPIGESLIIHHFFSFERTMDAWMLTFLAGIGLFMSWFPVRMTRNAVLYMSGFVVYFSARCVVLLLAGRTPAHILIISLVALSVSLACLLVWIAALRNQGEKVTTVIGQRWNPEAMARLSVQLDAINSRLQQLSRRSG